MDEAIGVGKRTPLAVRATVRAKPRRPAGFQPARPQPHFRHLHVLIHVNSMIFADPMPACYAAPSSLPL
jgi:hypothetical protein